MSIELHVDHWKLKPYAHQVQGVRLLIENPAFALWDEMGCGKSNQVVNAACELFTAGEIDAVLVVTPAAVRSVWLNPEFGEIKKHSWVPSMVMEFHNPIKIIWNDKHPIDSKPLDWCVTNYEFLRGEKHREKLKNLLYGRKVLMVLDESSYIKSRGATQTKACMEIGRTVARRIILNGTPVANNPLDLWSQVNFLSTRILPYKNFYHFRAEHAIMGGWQNRQILKFVKLDKLQDYIRPYAIRREKKDCLDLPEKIYLTPVEVPMSEKTWNIYKQMKEDCVAWLNENPSMAAQAGVRIMRLSQITSGFLGGFVDMEEEVNEKGRVVPEAVEVGREKLDFLREWVKEKLVEEPGLKIIIWCRFRKELERVAADMADILPTYRLYGQGKKERAEAIAKFSQASDNSPAMLCGQVQAGGLGLNLIQAWVEVYLSNDFNLLTRLQSEDRVHRPGQTRNVLVLDVLATGPKSQKTIDHTIVKRLREKNDLATWTVSAWKKVLEEE